MDDIENTEEVKLLEAQIKSLEAEVKMLQERKKNCLSMDPKGSVQDAVSVITDRRREGQKEELLLRLKEEVEELEEELGRQTHMNGFTLDRCSIKILQNGERETLRKFKVSGSCSDVEFMVEFNLTEKKEGQSSQRRISGLNVVMDNIDLQHFGSFLSGLEESCDLPLLFRTLRTFSDRCEDRRRTFLHFQEEFPSVVSLPEGSMSEVMTLKPPQLSSCVWFVHWSVEVSADGVVVPKLDLLTKISEEALQLFPSLAAEGAAEAFTSLLRLLGPEAALESIIRALGPAPEPEVRG